MTGHARTVLAICLSLGLLAALPASAARPAGTPDSKAHDEPILHVEVLRVAADARSRRQARVSRAACKDRLYNLDGARWRTTYGWSFRARSTPRSLSRNAAEAAIRRGVANIVGARNDCGRADRVNARARYLGRTGAAPSCRRTDGRNVVGFRSLPAGVAARACWWMRGSRIIEADIQVNSNIGWATSLAGCSNELMLEAVMTHEAGHVFGLGHVGERRHGRLTMSTYIDGPCNNQEATLGLGDMRGLEALYP